MTRQCPAAPASRQPWTMPQVGSCRRIAMQCAGVRAGMFRLPCWPAWHCCDMFGQGSLRRTASIHPLNPLRAVPQARMGTRQQFTQVWTMHTRRTAQQSSTRHPATCPPAALSTCMPGR
jgi:hypothetical protein